MTKINQEEYKFLKGLNDYWKWKWIARDSDGNHGGNLFAYSEKPYKDCYTKDWRVSSLEWFNIDNRLFQFVQWEDSEPYSIAWLLGEYEEAEYGYFNNELYERFYEESEEAEVKKDIDWAIQEIEGLETEPSQNYPHDKMIEREIVLGILSQLDEPEVLSQEDNINIVLDDLKEHIKEQQSLSQNVGMAHTPAGNDTHYRQYDYALECINEYEPSDDLQNLLLPEKELPVIPQFVAEWIEVSRKATYHLLGAVYYGAYNEDMKEWLFKGDKRTRQDNQDKLTRAWLDGFTVKEEQRYYAMIKGHENIGSDDKYWNYCITDESLFIDDNKVHPDVLGEYVLSATKDEWKNLGISDDNADFVKVEELEK